MQKLAYPDDKRIPYILTLTTYASYVVIFLLYHDRIGSGLAALATIPVIVASWYFGILGGLMVAVLSILTNIVILTVHGQAQNASLLDPANEIRIFSLLIIALAIGKLREVIRERSTALLKLEQYEQERQGHTSFLERLNEITALALEADNLDSTLKILGERIAPLFKADDCFFSRWDDAKHVPIPMFASGSLSDIYPYMQFEPGELTLTTSVMEAGHPIAVPDIENSPYISPQVAALFPSRSMLGLPLIAQQRKMGALLLGYKKTRSFCENDFSHAQLTAEQVSLVLSKSLFLEEQRKQVKQLTALHDIALIAIDVDNEDELINRVTDVIGQNLFPDNCGILLLDEPSGVLHAHPSYRFFSPEEHDRMSVLLDQGVTGKVASTGQAQRIGNVRRVREYFEVDERTISELCVPIKFKERILGVINVESTKSDAFTEDDERLLITLAGQIATALEQIRKAQAERKWFDQLAHSNALIYALAQITTHIEKAFSIDEIIRNLGAELDKIGLTCIMAVHDRERKLFTVNYSSLDPWLLDLVESGLGRPLIQFTFSGDEMSRVEVLAPRALSKHDDDTGRVSARSGMRGISEVLQCIDVGPETEPLHLPLVFEENVLGILWTWGKGVTRADLPIISIFAKQIGVSLERARLFQEVQNLAITDSLTGLQNRRSVFEVGRVEFTRAQKMNRPFCCMMLDIDHFKLVNDEYGHMIGDQVLQEFANRCQDSVRDMDLIGRYGGEELIIFLPDIGKETALQIAERLRLFIAAVPMTVSEGKISITVSIGIAERDENTIDLETLIARADQAMYIAKHKGRNCVAISR